MSDLTLRRAHQAAMIIGLVLCVEGGGDVVEASLSGLNPFGSNLLGTGAWVLWGVALAATLVRLPSSLTALRLSTTVGLAALVLACVVADASPAQVAWALTPTLVVAAVSLSPVVGQEWVDGASYGDEQRFTLRTPTSLAVVGLPLGWMLVAAGVLAGPILLANERWVLGTVGTIVGLYLAMLGVRALHGLARRWLVMVPAGLVLHDHLATREAFLMVKATVAGVRPAPANVALDAEQRLDATGDAPGAVVEIGLTNVVECVPRPERGQAAEVRRVSSILVVPSRPRPFIEAARARRLGRRE